VSVFHARQAYDDLKEDIRMFLNECSRDPERSLVTPAPTELQELWAKIWLETLQAKSKPEATSWFEWFSKHTAQDLERAIA
jgi:hypothetical protein